MRRITYLLAAGALVASACGGGGRNGGGGYGGNGWPTGDDLATGGGNGGGDDGGGQIPNCSNGGDPNTDQDNDGYTPAQGDCDDCNPSINPGAIQIPGDPVDYACNGKPGVLPACDANVAGKRDPSSLAAAFDQCDPRFFKGAMTVGWSDMRARKAVPHYGIIVPRAGKSMALLSNGIAADKKDPDFDPMNEENPGTDLSNNGQNDTSHANPLPNLKGVPGCSQNQPGQVNDYTEVVVKLKAPTNANSFSFDFQFFSAEYPMYVCTEYNDEFLVLQDSAGEFGGAPTNIAFDMQKNPITINNGFFTVCTNDNSKPQTQHCKKPVSGIDGTGFEDLPGGGGGILPCQSDQDCFGIGACVKGSCAIGGDIPGGSTGWLTTKSPVTPGEEVTLHFIIFDEGDNILDSAVLIDNFQWGAVAVKAPTTTPIQ